MKELFYFSKSDLMIQVQYSNHAKALRYASHRQITEDERQAIERYIAENIIAEKESGKYKDASLDYLGIDYKLVSSLNQFHAIKPYKETEESFKEQESNPFGNLNNKNIDRSVKDLIKTSMENYYFEKIGNTIVELRKKIEGNQNETVILKLQNNLEQLVDAYNQFSPRKVEFKEILPKELVV